MKCLMISIAVFLFSVSPLKSRAQDTSLFDYKPLANVFDIEKTSRRGNILIDEILFDSPKGGKVTAFLVAPEKLKGKTGAVIYVHGAGANKTQFLEEAVTLATQKKLTVLVFDTPSARRKPWQKSEYDSLTSDREMRIQTIIDARQAHDILSGLPSVDARRIVFVGYSYGASVGGVLAGVDKRFAGFVLIGSGGSQLEFWRDGQNPDAQNLRRILTPEKFEKFVETLAPLEQIEYIKNSAPSKLLFQFATRDEWTPRERAERFYQAAAEPKEVKWYQADHSFNRKALKDRLKWIGKVTKID